MSTNRSDYERDVARDAIREDRIDRDFQSTLDKLQVAYDQGQWDYRHKVKDNVYVERSQEWHAYNRGWGDARHEMD